MRVLLDKDPFIDPQVVWLHRGTWPAKWIWHPDLHDDEIAVVGFRRRFKLDKPSKLRIHVSADERYELFLDGERVGRGPERGDRENWFFESYDLDLAAGDHVLAARVWWLGPNGPAPYAQHTVRPGFLLAAEGVPDDLLNTGVAPWECKELPGHDLVSPGSAWGTGAKLHVIGSKFAWGFEKGGGRGWETAKVVGTARNASVANEFPHIWKLRPAILPAMLETTLQVGDARHIRSVKSDDTRPIQVKTSDHLASEAESWNKLLAGKSSLTIPAHTMRRAIIDLGNYYCAFPEVTTSDGKGAKIRVLWAEALYENPDGGAKGNRDVIEGKYFIGFGDTFEPDGGKSRRFDTLWWEAGRYLEVFISTADEPLVIEGLRIRETHYPYDFQMEFESADPRLQDVIPIAKRVLEMCSHETYMDCPYYEQLQYIGDVRLQVLATYAFTQDDRMPRQAIEMFDLSRLNSGITQSRYPSRVCQIIPTFSLWWIGMVHDYAMWRDDMGFVAERMRGVRAVLDIFRSWVNADGLLTAPNGWNFVDWVPKWGWGLPPDAEFGISGIVNWLMVYALGLAADLEEMLGENELAERDRKLARRMAKALDKAFWSEERGIFADDLAKTSFSEHSQCLALLTGLVDDSKREKVIHGLLHDPDLERTTIFFTHYLFETCRLIGRMDRFFERMGLWFEMKGLGFKTTLEHPEPSRSDCHAWGAHPIYHYFASLLGIRPAAPGFARVEVAPQMWPLTWAKGKLPHPKGFITVDLAIKNGDLTGTVELPAGVTGTLAYNGKTRALKSGAQSVS